MFSLYPCMQTTWLMLQTLISKSQTPTPWKWWSRLVPYCTDLCCIQDAYDAWNDGAVFTLVLLADQLNVPQFAKVEVTLFLQPIHCQFQIHQLSKWKQPTKIEQENEHRNDSPDMSFINSYQHTRQANSATERYPTIVALMSGHKWHTETARAFGSNCSSLGEEFSILKEKAITCFVDNFSPEVLRYGAGEIVFYTRLHNRICFNKTSSLPTSSECYRF